MVFASEGFHCIEIIYYLLTVKYLDALSSAGLRLLVLRLFLRDEDLGDSSLPCEFICVRDRTSYSLMEFQQPIHVHPRL